MSSKRLPELRLDKLAVSIFRSARVDGSIKDLIDILDGVGMEGFTLTGRRRQAFGPVCALTRIPYGMLLGSMIKSPLSYFQWRLMWDTFIKATKEGDRRTLRHLHSKLHKLVGMPLTSPSRCSPATVGVAILLMIPTALLGCVRVSNGYRVVTNGHVRFEVNSTYIVDNDQIIQLPLGKIRWEYCRWKLPAFVWRTKSLLEYADSSPNRVSLTSRLLALYQIQYAREFPDGNADEALSAELRHFLEQPPPVLREIAPVELEETIQPYGEDDQPMPYVYPLESMATPKDLVDYYNVALFREELGEKNPKVDVNLLSLFLRYCVQGEMSQKTFAGLVKAPAIHRGRANIKPISKTRLAALLPTFSSYL